MRRYTFIRQTQPGDGAAEALATVCLHHGISVEPAQIRPVAGAGLAALIHAAESLGLNSRLVKLDYDPLTQLPLPALAPLRHPTGKEHVVVLHRVDPHTVVVADPSSDGIQTLPREEFCRGWCGRVLVLTRDTALPANSGASASGRLAGLLWLHSTLLLEIALCSLFLTLFGLASAMVLRLLIDWTAANGEVNFLTMVVLTLAGLLACRWVFATARDALCLHLSRRVAVPLTSCYVHHLLRLPLATFDHYSSGDLTARLLDTDKLRATVSVAVGLLLDLLGVGAALTVLGLMHGLIALTVAVGVIQLGLIVLLFSWAQRSRAEKAGHQQGVLAAHLTENVLGIDTFRGTGSERGRAEACESSLYAWLYARSSLERTQLLLRTATTLGVGVILLLVLWFGGSAVGDITLTLGQWGCCLVLTCLALDPLRRIANTQSLWQQGLTALGRLDAVLAQSTDDAVGRRKVLFQELQQGIALENVGFGYPTRGKVFEGLSLTIPAGRTIAIVGASGCGKTTLLRLLLGSYRAGEGQLKFDGVDLRDFDPGSLREQIGLIEQDAMIVQGTIADNVALGHPDAGLAEIMAALSAAGLEEFVSRLPQRHETAIAERGRNLSSGQRQQLALARALFRQPRILLLDEATSHLDAATERTVLDAIRWSLPGRTLVLTTQRLSNAQNTDWVYLLHQGRVLESGPHADLLALNGFYAALWRAQTDPNDPAIHNSLAAPLQGIPIRATPAGSHPR